MANAPTADAIPATSASQNSAPSAPSGGLPSRAPAARLAPSPPPVPSVGRQKTFITDNAAILNLETKKAILSLVMMEIGPTVVTEIGAAKEVDIDLDAVAEANEDVLHNIYNMVRARLEILSLPAHSGGSWKA